MLTKNLCDIPFNLRARRPRDPNTASGAPLALLSPPGLLGLPMAILWISGTLKGLPLAFLLNYLKNPPGAAKGLGLPCTSPGPSGTVEGLLSLSLAFPWAS